MMSKRRLLIPLSLLLTHVVHAEWLELEPGTYPVTIETSGSVVSKSKQIFTPPIGFQWNRTISFMAKEGQKVREGDLLLTFDGTNEDERFRRIQQDLNLKQAELESMTERHSQEIEKEKLDLAEAESKALKARRKASQPVELLPSIEYQKLVEQRDLAEFQLKQLTQRMVLSTRVREASLRALKVTINRHEQRMASIKQEIDGLTIHSPKAGLVLIGSNFNDEKFDVGDRVQSSDVVLELVDGEQFEVDAQVSESQAARLAVGQAVRMKSESTVDKEFTGKILSLGNTVRRKSRRSEEMVREFTVELDDQEVGLRLGIPVHVVIEVDVRENAIAVPIDSLIYRDSLPGVETRSGWQRVELGERSNGKVIILDGLERASEILI